MKRKISALGIILFFLASGLVWAADKMMSYSIAEAIGNTKVQEALIPDVKLYWGEQSHPAIEKMYGEFKTSKRTNALGKSKETACRWALATSLKVLQDRALREGGNAVVNIRSNIRNNEKSSTTEFECLVGSVIVNSALIGDVVKLK